MDIVKYLDKKIEDDIKHLYKYFGLSNENFKKYKFNQLILENLEKYDNNKECFCIMLSSFRKNDYIQHVFDEDEFNQNIQYDDKVYLNEKCNFCIIKTLKEENGIIEQNYKIKFNETNTILKNFLLSQNINENLDTLLSSRKNFDFQTNYILYLFQYYYTTLDKFFLKILLIKYTNFTKLLENYFNNNIDIHNLKDYDEQYKNFLINKLLKLKISKLNYLKEHKYCDTLYILMVYYSIYDINKFESIVNTIEIDFYRMCEYFFQFGKLSDIANFINISYKSGKELSDIYNHLPVYYEEKNFLWIYMSILNDEKDDPNIEEEKFDLIIDDEFFNRWEKRLKNKNYLSEFLNLILTKENIIFDENPKIISNVYYFFFLLNKNIPNSKIENVIKLEEENFNQNTIRDFFYICEKHIVKVLENPLVYNILYKYSQESLTKYRNCNKIHNFIENCLKQNIIPKNVLHQYLNLLLKIEI